MPRSARVLLLLVTVSLLAAVSGCGYAQKELYPTDIRTVGVPIFQNRTFYQGVEFDLTEALTKEIELRTPYKVVKPAAADSVIEGTITEIKQVRLSRVREGGVPQEIELRLTANVEWKNLRTGQVLRERKGIETVGRYVPTNPIGETINVGQHGAVQMMATQIVSAMRADW